MTAARAPAMESSMLLPRQRLPLEAAKALDRTSLQATRFPYSYLLDPSARNESTEMTPPRKPQVRMRYSKLGKVRFTSHRDMARIWERSVRKVKLPIAYSEGFSPRARLSFGLALPTVFESVAEFVDLTLETPVDPETLPALLSEALPNGVDVTGAIALDGKVDSLQECVEATQWSLFVDGDPAEHSTWVDEILAADEVMLTRERKGKSRTDDVREAIHSLEVDTVVDDGSPMAVPFATAVLTAGLATKPRALRPLELLGINTLPGNLLRGRRTHQFIAPVGARRDPLAFGAATEPHSMVCAS